ncbi:unnamed protein product [Paramecium octaurelia]|uniref:Uncharacterized protein n=1 Tax=Paramecium octaurelia TaxID=43137 RepID=A0A8S1YSW0_PAROT|nr:unnamed protein product [Paramecium octaurelia]
MKKIQINSNKIWKIYIFQRYLLIWNRQRTRRKMVYGLINEMEKHLEIQVGTFKMGKSKVNGMSQLRIFEDKLQQSSSSIGMGRIHGYLKIGIWDISIMKQRLDIREYKIDKKVGKWDIFVEGIEIQQYRVKECLVMVDCMTKKVMGKRLEHGLSQAKNIEKQQRLSK